MKDFTKEKEKAKLNIKRNLWRWGFKCKDVSDVTNYDLHVREGERSFRVKVILAEHMPNPLRLDVSEMKIGEQGCDVLAVVTGKRSKPRLYSLGGKENDAGLKPFEEWHDTPLGVFREAKRKEAEPSP